MASHQIPPAPVPPATRDLWTTRAGAEIEMAVNNAADKYGLTDIETAAMIGEVLLHRLRRIELASRAQQTRPNSVQ